MTTRILYSFAVATLLMLSACSAKNEKTLLLEGTTEQREGVMFSELESFYCLHKRWPTDWTELSKHLVEDGISEETLQIFKGASLESPRAIILRLSYTLPSGEIRTTGFFAPPVCTKEPIPDRQDGQVISVAAGRIQFVVPKSFILLPSAAIRERWVNPPFPDAGWEDQAAKITVALRFGETAATVEDLEGLKDATDEAYAIAVPGFFLIRSGQSVSTRLANMEHRFESDSSRGRLSTCTYTLVFEGKLFSISVVGPVEAAAEVDRVADILIRSFTM